MSASQTIARRIIEREGGFVHHPNDRGGATKYGVTLRTLQSVRPGATKEDVLALTEREAVDIYVRLYIDGPGIDGIAHDLLKEFTADCSVHHGQVKAVQMLQQAVNEAQGQKLLEADGKLGPMTCRAVNGPNARNILKAFIKIRLGFFARIVERDSSQRGFLEGWVNRVCEFIARL